MSQEQNREREKAKEKMFRELVYSIHFTSLVTFSGLLLLFPPVGETKGVYLYHLHLLFIEGDKLSTGVSQLGTTL